MPKLGELITMSPETMRHFSDLANALDDHTSLVGRKAGWVPPSFPRLEELMHAVWKVMLDHSTEVRAGSYRVVDKEFNPTNTIRTVIPGHTQDYYHKMATSLSGHMRDRGLTYNSNDLAREGKAARGRAVSWYVSPVWMPAPPKDGGRTLSQKDEAVLKQRVLQYEDSPVSKDVDITLIPIPDPLTPERAVEYIGKLIKAWRKLKEEYKTTKNSLDALVVIHNDTKTELKEAMELLDEALSSTADRDWQEARDQIAATLEE
jgi:hypothetical protein